MNVPNFTETTTNYQQLCHCGIKAVPKEVKANTPNKGRLFWSCSKYPNGDCKFFKWVDNDPSFMRNRFSRPEAPNLLADNNNNNNDNDNDDNNSNNSSRSSSCSSNNNSNEVNSNSDQFSEYMTARIAVTTSRNFNRSTSLLSPTRSLSPPVTTTTTTVAENDNTTNNNGIFARFTQLLQNHVSRSGKI
jgi:hypothetical protein